VIPIHERDMNRRVSIQVLMTFKGYAQREKLKASTLMYRYEKRKKHEW